LIKYDQLDETRPEEFMKILLYAISMYDVDKETLSVLADLSRTIGGGEDPETILITICQSYTTNEYHELKKLYADLAEKSTHSLGKSHK
jgi:hypothetical protein